MQERFIIKRNLDLRNLQVRKEVEHYDKSNKIWRQFPCQRRTV